MSSLRVSAVSLSFVLLACGGSVAFEEDGGGDGGNGGSNATSTSATSTSGPTTGTSGTSTTTGNSTGGTGGSTSVAVSSTGVGSSVTVGPGTGGGSACSALNYAECLGDNGRCVPVFDDYCCPSCFPGGCADCIDFRGVACIDRQTGGGEPPPGPPPQACPTNGCGFVPDWACNGDKPDCSNGCFGNAGCVDKIRCQGDACEVSCEGIAPDACGPVNCNAPPPVCGEGSIAEASAGCWTGFCIPAWVCDFPAP